MLQDESPEIFFRAPIWLYTAAPTAWHFVTLPKAISTKIRSHYSANAKPFGSLPVTAQIGGTRWKTSIFRDKKRAAYLLPIKADVRAKEQLREGDSVEVLLTLNSG